MPELTRRRNLEAREDCWHVYYGDVHVGTIAIDSKSKKNPFGQIRWGSAGHFVLRWLIICDGAPGRAFEIVILPAF
jgi:hypothetical protein